MDIGIRRFVTISPNPGRAAASTRRSRPPYLVEISGLPVAWMGTRSYATEHAGTGRCSPCERCRTVDPGAYGHWRSNVSRTNIARMTRRRLRVLVRMLHLVLAIAIGIHVYLPPSVGIGLREALMYAGIPLAVVSGGYLWQQARVHRWLARREQVQAR